MRQTLFTISYEYAGVPIFGVGVLLAAWAIVAVLIVAGAVRRHGWNRETLGFVPVLVIVGAAIVLLPNFFPNGLPVRGYGVMMLAGIVSGVGLAYYRARQMGIDPELILSLAFWMVISGIFGARIFYVIEYWNEIYRQIYAQQSLGRFLFAVANVSQGGLVVYGSLISVGVAVLIFIRKHQLPGLALADLIAPSMMLGLAFGRVGCLMNGCCFGGQSDLPWHVTFPWGSPPHVRQAEEGTLLLHGIKLGEEPDSPPVIAEVLAGSQAERAGLRPGQRIIVIAGMSGDDGDDDGDDGGDDGQWITYNRSLLRTTRDAQLALLQFHGEGTRFAITTSDRPSTKKTWVLPAAPRSKPIHPTQIYSSINALLMCLFLLAFYPYRTRDGQVLAMMLTIYPIARFLLEILRTDEHAIFGTGLSISQNVSLVVFALAVALWFYLAAKPRGTAWPRAVTAT